MLNKIDVSTYMRHINESNLIHGGAQWQDQFKLLVFRDAPETDITLSPHDILSFTINYPGIETKETKLGSSSIFTISGIDPVTITVDFLEGDSAKIEKFLFKRNNGRHVIPTDGTYLLPYDYFFRIEVYALDAYWKEKFLLSGEFLIDGQSTKEFVSDGGGKQQISVDFKPVMSNTIKW